MINNVGHTNNIKITLWVRIGDQLTLYMIGGPMRQMMASFFENLVHFSQTNYLSCEAYHVMFL